MVYIRVKKIQNQEYAYLVESVTTNKGPRQKVRHYLGKIHRLTLPESIEKNINTKTKQTFLLSLVENHLQTLGFVAKGRSHKRENLVFSAEDFSLQNQKLQKAVVLALEGGYLCTFTLQRILSFSKSRDVNHDAHTLAKYFLEAGLQISEQEFVKFYSLLD